VCFSALRHHLHSWLAISLYTMPAAVSASKYVVGRSGLCKFNGDQPR